MSPTARTLKELRDNGWTAEVVERWNPYARIRQDLFNVIDIVAIKPGCGIMGVQATSGGNVSARVKKAEAEPKLAAWLNSGGRFSVCGWAKRGPRGGRKTWEPRWVELPSKDGLLRERETRG